LDAAATMRRVALGSGLAATRHAAHARIEVRSLAEKEGEWSTLYFGTALN
jgi:hypothetical protein